MRSARHATGRSVEPCASARSKSRPSPKRTIAGARPTAARAFAPGRATGARAVYPAAAGRGPPRGDGRPPLPGVRAPCPGPRQLPGGGGRDQGGPPAPGPPRVELEPVGEAAAPREPVEPPDAVLV